MLVHLRRAQARLRRGRHGRREQRDRRTTRRWCVFESANFNGVSVRRTASALGMRTDASSRFEKGLDPMNTMHGRRARLRARGAARLRRGRRRRDRRGRQATRPPRSSSSNRDKINALLGTDTQPKTEMARNSCLASASPSNGDDIYVPSWRGDVEHYSRHCRGGRALLRLQ